MIVFDFLITMFYLFLKKYGNKGLEAAIFLLTLPSTLYIVALIIYLSQFILTKQHNLFSPIAVGLTIILIAVAINILLKKQYLSRYNYIEDYAKSLNNMALRVLIIFFAVIYYLFSAFVFFYSLKFLPR